MKMVAWLIAGLLILTTLGMCGDLDPLSSPTNPASAMFTLQDLYDRVAIGAAVSKRTAGFTNPSGAPTNRVGPTLDEIMAVLPAPADVTGAVRSGDVPDGLTFWGLIKDGWGLQTGTAAFVVDRIRGEYVRDISGPNPPTTGGTTGVLTGVFTLGGRAASVVNKYGRNLTVVTATDHSVSFIFQSGTGINDYTLRLDGTTMPVIVYLPNGTGAALVETNYLSLAYAAPTITSVSGCSDFGAMTVLCPCSGGNPISIDGMNFGTNVSLIGVTIGGLLCTNLTLINNDTTITCDLPANLAGGPNEKVAVTVDGLTGSAPNLSYVGPLISSINIQNELPEDPTPITGGTVLDIEGTGFDEMGSVTVKFGLADSPFADLLFTAALDYVSDTLIECTVPDGCGQNLELQVKVGSQVATYVGQHLQYPKPTILANSLRDSLGSSGNSVLTGTVTDGQVIYFDADNLGINSSLITVYIDETNECGHVTTHARGPLPMGTIGCTLPRGMGGNHSFTVQALNACSDLGTDTFSYPTAPQVTNVSGCVNVPPATTECPTAGGMPLTLRGENFSGDALLVLIDGNAARASCISSSQITCTLPPGIGKQVAVVVQNGGLSSMPQAFVSYASPAITSITATNTSARSVGNTVTDLPRTGGIEIQIHGTNFGASGGQLLISDTRCTDLIHDAANPHGLLRAALPSRTAPPYNDLPCLLINAAGEMATNVFYVSYTEW